MNNHSSDLFQIDLDSLYPKPDSMDIKESSRSEKINRSWQSVQIRADFCKYHYCEFRETFDRLIDSNKQHAATDIQVHNSTFQLELKLRAHVLAFMQCLHAIGDTIGVIISDCWTETLCAPYLKDIAHLKTDQRKLKNVQLSKHFLREAPQTAEVVHLAKLIVENSEFRYLQAYVNQVKHNELVDLSLKQCSHGGELSVKFDRFVRIKSNSKELVSYPQQGEELFDVSSFMEKAHSELLPLIQKIQIAIKDSVRAMALAK